MRLGGGGAAGLTGEPFTPLRGPWRRGNRPRRVGVGVPCLGGSWGRAGRLPCRVLPSGDAGCVCVWGGEVCGKLRPPSVWLESVSPAARAEVELCLPGGRPDAARLKGQRRFHRVCVWGGEFRLAGLRKGRSGAALPTRGSLALLAAGGATPAGLEGGASLLEECKPWGGRAVPGEGLLHLWNPPGIFLIARELGPPLPASALGRMVNFTIFLIRGKCH